MKVPLVCLILGTAVTCTNGNPRAFLPLLSYKIALGISNSNPYTFVFIKILCHENKNKKLKNVEYNTTDESNIIYSFFEFNHIFFSKDKIS